jgi:predicted TIM-barrel fold metal-dependent hydrolase
MPIIDAQVHCYEANTPARPWRTDYDHRTPVTGDQMVKAFDKVGVDGAILVSPYGAYGYDASYAVSVQRAHPGRFAIVSPMDPDDPAVEEKVAEWKKQPGAVAVRVLISPSSGNAPDAPGIPRILRAAARHGLVVNLQCGGNLDVGTALIDAHPQTRFALDHLGVSQPRKWPAPADVWDFLPSLLELARRPNVVLKVSGACTMAREPYPYPDLWAPLARVFDAWGLERCLWGSDWTRTQEFVSYEQAIEPFRMNERLSEGERAMLMGGAVAKAYGWMPRQ